MTEQQPDQNPEPGAKAKDGQKLTAFGEPLWVDVMKTIGVFAALLGGTVLVGAILGVMIIAPWGRESFDCSIYCVLERELTELFSGKPS